MSFTETVVECRILHPQRVVKIARRDGTGILCWATVICIVTTFIEQLRLGRLKDAQTRLPDRQPQSSGSVSALKARTTSPSTMTDCAAARQTSTCARDQIGNMRNGDHTA
jgi:hypothetical protein